MGLNSAENGCVFGSGIGSSPTRTLPMALSASPESPGGSNPSLNDVDFDGDACGGKLRRNLSDDQVADIIASEGRRPSRRRGSDDEDASRTARRLMTNKRERYRQQLVNDAFSQLRHLIPTFPPDKKLSKHDVLKQAARYIHYVQTMLSEAIEQQQRSINPETAKTMTGSIREKQDWHFASMYTHMPLGSPTQTMATFPGSLTPSRSTDGLPRQSSQPVDGFPRTSSTALTPGEGYYAGTSSAGGFPALPDGQRSVAHPQATRHMPSTSSPSSESYGPPVSHARTQVSMPSSSLAEENVSRVQPQAVAHTTMRQHSIDDRSLSPGQQPMPGANGFATWMRASPGEEANSAPRHVEYSQFPSRGVVERHVAAPQQLIYAAQNDVKGPRQYVVSPSQPTGRFVDEQYRYVGEAPRSEAYPRGVPNQDSYSNSHRTQPQQAHALY